MTVKRIQQFGAHSVYSVRAPQTYTPATYDLYTYICITFIKKNRINQIQIWYIVKRYD